MKNKNKPELTIITGGPGSGKTALALKVALKVATLRKPRNVAVFSLDMCKNSILDRLIEYTAVKLKEYRSGTLSIAPGAKMYYSYKVTQAPLYIDDTPALTAEQIIMRARQFAGDAGARGEKLELIVIDYLQLTGDINKGCAKPDKIVNRLSCLVKDLGASLIITAQLPRSLPKESDQRRKRAIADYFGLDEKSIRTLPEKPSRMPSADFFGKKLNSLKRERSRGML